MYQTFEKGKFYALPILRIEVEGKHHFFIISANGREQAIKMLKVQQNDPKIAELKALHCMVKEVYDDQIIFVQNVSKMFEHKFEHGKAYTFKVGREVPSYHPTFRYYDLFSAEGIPFRLKCERNVRLLPHQDVSCRVERMPWGQLQLHLVQQTVQPQGKAMSLEELLQMGQITGLLKAWFKKQFRHSDHWQEARLLEQQGQRDWPLVALLNTKLTQLSRHFSPRSQKRLLELYQHTALALLEESGYLLLFAEKQQKDYGKRLEDRISIAQSLLEALELIEQGEDDKMVAELLQKFQQSTYLYRVQQRLLLLSALFHSKASLLEEHIPTLLSFLTPNQTTGSRSELLPFFAHILQLYIDRYKEKTYQQAMAHNSLATPLLRNMVQCCQLLLRQSKSTAPLQCSHLLQCLAFDQQNTSFLPQEQREHNAQALLERAFESLAGQYRLDESQVYEAQAHSNDVLAHQILQKPSSPTLCVPQVLELHGLRISLLPEGFTIARTPSTSKDYSLLPKGFLDWREVKIFGDLPRHQRRQGNDILSWRNYWNAVERTLFAPPVSQP